MLTNFFSANKKEVKQAAGVKTVNKSMSNLPRDEMESEYKQVITLMQDQITVKAGEVQKLKEVIEDLKLKLTKEKQLVVDANQDMVEYRKQKLTMDQILTQRDKEIAKLTEEIKKLRQSSENEIKKLKKQMAPQAVNYATEIP